MAFGPRHTRRRDESPKRYSRSRSTWHSPRRSRLLSWSLCALVLLLIVFWPQKREDSLTKLRRKRSSSKQTDTPTVKERPRERDHHIPHERNEYDSTPQNPKKPKKQRAAAQPAEHIFRADGLVDVNPKGNHPIFELIERSETQWKRKVERQSKTLKQAVEEYKRRYKRAPPKGFEIWWDYVDFHDVKLVDEYDSIHARLQPFWGVSPLTLRAIQTEWESHSDTFTIGKLPGAAKITLLNNTMKGSRLGNQRVNDQIDLLEDVQEWLPEFRATFTMHDGPQQFVSWDLRRAAEQASEKGEYIDVERIASTVNAKGWAAACPPNTPIHSYTPPGTSPLSQTSLESPPAKKSFIYNHRLAMSPCHHPAHLTLSGYLSQYLYHLQTPDPQLGPTPNNRLIPTFSICASTLHSDILTVAPEQFEDDIGADPEWHDKVDERLLWRGSNTGVLHQTGNMWNSSHRIRLIEMGTRRGGTTKVLLPPREGESEKVGYGEEIRMSALNAGFMDVSFVGKPIQCRDPICGELQQMFEWKKHQSWKDAWVYKYIMDIDGNGWSARFKRLMTSKSLIFKATIFPEWYTERIMPWVHYIPVQVDLSDLYDILAFFRGDLSGAGAHDDLAQKIANAGKVWSETVYRREDMTAYQFRLFLEYARVMSLDREAMSYQEEAVDEVNDYDEL